MTAEVDRIVKLYKRLSQVPALTGARFGSTNQLVDSVWTQRNVEKGKTTKFAKTVLLGADYTKIGESIPLDISSELLSATSPSGRFRAVLRDADDKQYLEIWQNANLHRTVDLLALDAHGKVYTDGEFLTFQWSPDEKRLLYVAELKRPKAEPFYKRAARKKDEEARRGEEYLFRQDWGEQMVGKVQSVIAEYLVEEDRVEVAAGPPEGVCPAQVVYSPSGAALVGVAYETSPRKLGIIYCTNRPSTVFWLEGGKYETLELEGQAVRSPVFTPDGKKLLWLQRRAGGLHAGAVALMSTPVPLSKAGAKTIALDAVQTRIKTDNDEEFYGLYNSGFVRRCFASGNRLVLATNQRNTINTYVIDVDSGKISELTYNDGSQLVLDVKDDLILANRRNFLRKDQLVLGKLPAKGDEAPINWIELSESEVVEGLEGNEYEYLEIVQSGNDSVKTSTAIYLGPKTGAAASCPLIVWPHGGPHSAYANAFALEGALGLALGYAVLFVNYRGSIGAGQASVDFLPGRIGAADVADCLLAAEAALGARPLLDARRMALAGGSHGGFLVAHLSGQRPGMFRAVVARNPVIDVASMSIISDIPDWCHVEAGREYTQVGKVDDELLLAMRRASPIEYAHLVKAPTLLQLGSKDLRVPPAQGLDYYYRLKANGVNVRVNLYEESHPLGGVASEMDNLINSFLWIGEHSQ